MTDLKANFQNLTTAGGQIGAAASRCDGIINHSEAALHSAAQSAGDAGLSGALTVLAAQLGLASGPLISSLHSLGQLAIMSAQALDKSDAQLGVAAENPGG
jgi:hypothetical protein